MLTLHNTTTALPRGMEQVKNPDFIAAVRFLQSQYPGIWKVKIRHRGRTKKAVYIRITTATDKQRAKTGRGYSLMSALTHLLERILEDHDMIRRLTHPELYPPQVFKTGTNIPVSAQINC